MRLPQITFPAQPHITIVIVTPFDRYGAEYLDDARITLNFVEATLEAYTKLKRTGATVNVVSVMSGQIERETAPTASISDLDITWLFELEENQCEKVPFQLLPRLNVFTILVGCKDATKESILAMLFLENHRRPITLHYGLALWKCWTRKWKNESERSVEERNCLELQCRGLKRRSFNVSTSATLFYKTDLIDNRYGSPLFCNKKFQIPSLLSDA